MSNTAAHTFQRMWDALPDHEVPPTEGPFYQGDICKVQGKAMVYHNGEWRDPEPLSKERYVIELLP